MPLEGENFDPSEPYTQRLRGILEEYPDGSQVLREILQNSDDAKSTEQIFILDHNTYPSSNLFNPKLDRYQGPALLAKNSENFEEKDFKSLLNLANSKKRDQFDKIGVMGVGFNSIYHLTDSPSFITGDKYVILDPHKWIYTGGMKFNFIKNKLAEEYPEQFIPFKIPCGEPHDSPFKEPFKGTIFRYPLRNSTESDISKKNYKSEEILDMFRKFYEKESINCLLFLKYIECIRFYELKKDATDLELLYTIRLENAEEVRRQRQLIAENIVPMMSLLNSNEKVDILETSSYVASFSRQQKGDAEEINEWLILNYLDDLSETEKYFKKEFDKSIRDYKFIPNIGLAIPLNGLNVTGRLFCFLPLPIDMPFPVSVHGYFAVSTNRRTLWSADDSEELAEDAIARLKVKWNLYLFENVLPKAWAKFLRELPFKVPNIRSDNVYNKFWPIVEKAKSGVMSSFCKGLLQNIIENLDIKDQVFKGPSLSNTIGTVSNISADSYDLSSFKKSEFYWLSLSNGYLEDEKSYNVVLTEIVGNIGFPVLPNLPPIIVNALENSKHKDSLHFFSPALIRTYLRCNIDRWKEGVIEKKKILQLFEYILKGGMFDELEGFKMIPLADGTLEILTTKSDSYVYIGPNNDVECDKNDERNIFDKKKFVDKSIEIYGLYHCLYENAKNKWNLNIKILDESAVAKMIKFSLNYDSNFEEEISISNNRKWIDQLWDNLKYRDWKLSYFEDIHLIPTNRSTLRKLKTPKKIFSRKNISTDSLVSIFEKFGAVFVDSEFDIEWNKMSPYVINPEDIISVLDSFRSDTSYPRNLNCTLQISEASVLANHLSIHSQRCRSITSELINVIKHFPIFTKVDHTSPISLSSENGNWYLLPREEENSYGKIIYPSNMGGFLSTSSRDICYILEEIIKISRLTLIDYWRTYVIPYIESQSPKDIDIVIDKLFDRLPKFDRSLKDLLGRKSFVPACTLQQQTPEYVKLFKPTELFDPEEKMVIDLFFGDEQVFPSGKYASNSFLMNLRSLGIKSALSPNDIISRIDTIIARRQASNIHEDLIHTKALGLFKYVDKNWDRLINNNSHNLKAILEGEWIPTVDKSGKKSFSKPQDCYHKEYRNLVCLVKPVSNYTPKNKNILKYLKWDTYPDVETILNQLRSCRDGVAKKQPPEELKPICNAIYKYMDNAFKNDNTSFDRMKECLRNKPWILCGNKFHSSNEVVINLTIPNNNNSLIVKLPIEYTSEFESLFKAMEVRDEVGVKDLISIVKNMVERDGNGDLSIDEIENVIQILEQIIKIQKDTKREGRDPESLDGLLIPSTKNKLASLKEIHFDDMEDRIDNEKKSEYIIAHDLVHLRIAKELKIQTLAGKICGINNNTGDFDLEVYEQHESLTTRIKNIIKDYKLDKLIKEFLQNADDAKATRFSVIVDRRQHNAHKKSLLSEDMKDLQGPAIWIYNDAVFSKDDFQGLTELGIGGKSRDKNENDTRIGKFGIGFNCSFHVTDLPSLVSGEYIVFLDPHAKFLPATGYPPRSRKGARINFIENEFKTSFPDQCYPYKAIEGCDFTQEFKGTLFRLPLRTYKSVFQSKISNQVFEINEILGIFNEIKSNKEMLFLRNVESCSLYDMNDRTSKLIWQAKINNNDNCCSSRQKVIDSIDNAQIYQLEIESENYVEKKKVSEIWAICTGGHDSIKSDLIRKFSKESRLKPRGGVASLLASSEGKSLDELKAESFPNPPKLKGEMFSYLSISMVSDLGVHLNGNFSLNSARLQSENDFLQSNCVEARWNKYILLEVLPDLHVKLLEYIMEFEKERQNKERSSFIPHITNNLWPINRNLTAELFKNYGLNVIRKLGLNDNKFFWTEANGGQFVSLREAKILEKEKTSTCIAEILINLKVPIKVVKLDKEQMEQMDKITESKEPINFPYTPINGKSLCEELQVMRLHNPRDNIIRNNVNNTNHVHDSLFQLLTFILQDKDSFVSLSRLPLVPLSDGIGDFDNVYYIGKQEHLDLFPKAGPSKFISMDLPKELLEIFSSEEFSNITNIKNFDASAILALLKDELPNVAVFSWDPDRISIPKNKWLKDVWSKLSEAKDIEFTELSKFPLLPITRSNVLIRIDVTNPPLYDNGHSLIPVLVKLKIRFTNMEFSESPHEDLKNCVGEFNSVNIVKSLKKTCSSLNLTIEHLFRNSNLSSSEYKKFRGFIKEELETLIEYGQKQKNFMNDLKSLPIWSINSCEDEFIDAESGILLPYTLPFFSFRKNTNIYKCDKSDFDSLTMLGAKSISELEYVKNHIVMQDSMKFKTPSQSYIPFLQNVLSLNNTEIEEYFKQQEVIPNKSLAEFVRADTLYDTSNSLFHNIFSDTDDKILPVKLQDDPVCLEALRRIGLKFQVNCNTYIECAKELQIQQDGATESTDQELEDRARTLVHYLYRYIDTLNFNTNQWNEILGIKFVPSKKNFHDQFCREPKETSGFETFEELRSNKYKGICWTQCPLFDDSVEPINSFSGHHPEIGEPSVENIIEHWFTIVKMSKKDAWNTTNYNEQLKNVIKEIYEIMNKISNDKNHKMFIKLKITGKKIFLNGDDPLNERNWKVGSSLVFCSSEDDIKEGEYYKVKDCLKDYKDLLKLAGAIEIDPPTPPTPNPVSDQKEKLVKSLLDKLISQSDNDVIFNVSGKKKNEKIGASRYVLSAALPEYFGVMFNGRFSESANREVSVDNTRPDVFWILLRWLYGQSFEEAIKSVEPILREDLTTFLLDLLKATDFYGVDLKSEIEDKIMTRIGVVNVCRILDWSKRESNANRLADYCKEYIKSNRKLVENQLSELDKNASEEEISRKLESLLSDDI